jgi:nucleoside-diphosphate-sugar epimerase
MNRSNTLLVFGLGYTGAALAAAVSARGWAVTGTSRAGRDGTLAFDDAARVTAAICAASHVLVTIPPEPEGDPVLARYADALAASGAWLGYLSSTGVYGDTGGAWVDESAPLMGRRAPRNAADLAWQAMGARVFRLPGIYGPDRSALDRVREGRAHLTGLGGQVFSRVHVADIVAAVIAGFEGPPGAYNIGDEEPAPQDDVIAFACRLLGRPPPPVVDLAELSPAARAFYAENRRVAIGRAKRLLGWQPLYPDYRLGLRALSAITSPMPASTAPATASGDQT